MRWHKGTDGLDTSVIIITLIVGILVASIVATILVLLGLSKDVGLIVGFAILIGMAIFSVIWVMRKADFTNRAVRLNPEVENEFDPKLDLTTKILTKDHISEKKYLAFEFDRRLVLTESREKVLYYVGLGHLFNQDTYEELDLLIDLMAEDIRNRQIKFDFLISLPNIGSHIGVLLAKRLEVAYTIATKLVEKEDEYEPRYLYRGYEPKSNEVGLFFDDVISRGQTALKAIQRLREKNINVNQVYSFLDKGFGGVELLEREGIQVYSLINGENLVAHLERLGILTSEEVSLIAKERIEKRREILRL